MQLNPPQTQSRVVTALLCPQAAGGGCGQSHGAEPNPASLRPPTCLNYWESPGKVLKLPENAKPWVQVGEAKDGFGPHLQNV